MTLSAAEIAEIMRLIDESSFDELNLEMNGVKLQMRRSGRGPGVPARRRGTGSRDRGACASRALQASSAPPRRPHRPRRPRHRRAAAGHVLSSAQAGAAPFVDLGAEVEEDTVVGIIEVMKLMNTVRAGCGRHHEILAADGQLVEYGSVLMRVGTAADRCRSAGCSSPPRRDRDANHRNLPRARDRNRHRRVGGGSE